MVLNPTQFNVGANPVPEVAAGAARYRQMNGFMAPEQNYAQSVIPASASRAIGRAYVGMPHFDPAAMPAYKQMGEEVGRQFDHLTRPVSKGGMGVDVSVQHTDPYDFAGPEFAAQGKDATVEGLNAMRGDVQNGQLKILSSQATGGHPVFSNDRNDMFRAVHDVFGHLSSGRAVDMHGEDAAYQKHAAMFSPLARGAMTTETRGQNSALHLTGSFQDQKVGIMPRGMQRPGNLNPMQFGEMARARTDAVKENRKFGII